MSHDISRRTFLKLLGGGLAGAAAGGALVKREDILAFSMPIRLPGQPERTWEKSRRATISPSGKTCLSWALAACACRRPLQRRAGK